MISKKVGGIVASLLSLILVGVFIFPFAVSATVSVGDGPDQVQQNLNIGVQNIKNVSDMSSILETIVKWVYSVFFVVAVLFVLLAAYHFIQGGSNPKAVETAKAQLKYAVIAIVVALLATAVSVIIQKFMQSPTA
jgi:Na+/proline symporter